MEDYEYIRKFSSISIKNICADLKLLKDYGNIMRGTARKEKIKKVRKELERRLKVLENGN